MQNMHVYKCKNNGTSSTCIVYIFGIQNPENAFDYYRSFTHGLWETTCETLSMHKMPAKTKEYVTYKL